MTQPSRIDGLPDLPKRRLLACPFCSGEGRETKEADSDWPSKCFMFIQCSRCGARTANVYGSGDPSEWADARHNWNQRIACYEAGSAAAAQAAKQVPEGWVPCTITYAEGEDPEEVAFGPQRMMDRLKKWLDSYFAKVYAERYPIAAAPSATSPAEAAEAGQVKSQLAKDFPPMGGLTECDMGDSYE